MMRKRCAGTLEKWLKQERMPVYLYNMSGMTNNPITPAILKTVAEQHRNICGVKDSSMDFMTLLNYQIAMEKMDFELITGNDAQVLPAFRPEHLEESLQLPACSLNLR